MGIERTNRLGSVIEDIEGCKRGMRGGGGGVVLCASQQ